MVSSPTRSMNLEAPSMKRPLPFHVHATNSRGAAAAASRPIMICSKERQKKQQRESAINAANAMPVSVHFMDEQIVNSLPFFVTPFSAEKKRSFFSVKFIPVVRRD